MALALFPIAQFASALQTMGDGLTIKIIGFGFA
jgi:hypothetical protein